MAQQAKNLIDQVMDPHKFDRRTHIWDSQGHLIKKNLYTEYVIKGERYLERPINSGNLWTEGNQPAGRVIKTFSANGAVTKKDFQFEAPHVEYKPELTGDEAIMYQLEQERAARTELEKELAAIRAERAADKPAKAEVAPAAPLAKTMAQPRLTKD